MSNIDFFNGAVDDLVSGRRPLETRDISFGVPAERFGMRPGNSGAQNRVALQLAVNAGVPVSLTSPGTYDIDAPIDLTPSVGAYAYWSASSNVVGAPARIIGGGKNRVVLRMTTPGQSLFRVYSPSVVQNEAPYVSDLTLAGPGISNALSVGIQSGGVTGARSDIVNSPVFERVHFRDWHTCLRADDTNQATVRSCSFEGYNYGIELGYNCDTWLIEKNQFGDQSVPGSFTGNCSTGVATITNIAAATVATLRVGMYVVNPNFASGTTIISIDSTSQVTCSANATGSATGDTFRVVYGVGIRLTQAAHDGWPPFNTAGSGNAIILRNNHYLFQYRCYEILEAGSRGILSQMEYVERCRQFARLGNANQTGGIKQFRVDGMHVEATERTQVAFIEHIAQSSNEDARIYLRHIECTDNGPTVPWYKGNAVSRFKVEQCVMPTQGGANLIEIGSNSFPGGAASARDISVGGGPGNYTRTIAGGASTTLASIRGTDRVQITLDQAHTFNNPTEDALIAGDKIEFILIQPAVTGAYNVTFGTKFVNPAGTRVGTTGVITGGAINTRLNLSFMWDGANYIRTDGTNVTWRS